MSRQMLSASRASFNRRYRCAFSSAAGMASLARGLSSYIAGLLRCGYFRLLPKDAQQPLQRIVEFVDHPLLERDDGIIGDGDRLRTDLGAALSDVAVADAVRLAQVGEAVLGVEGVHLQGRGVDQQPGADELVVQMVLPQHVADVLAEEALDALAELLRPVD